MNPIHQLATLLGRKKRERKCPACGHTHVVAERLSKVAVPCPRCAKPVPPRST
ncbi:MAG: hypothetical protein HYR51_20445 [Candidatus Rokubacteria bacterium]|nr:hypothetical protein [Candidatus Rokubacteria bacterium]